VQVKWFSPFLLAVYDPASETFQSLCRCMSGFTDEFYAAATVRLGATAIPGPKPYYDTNERPDVWFEPTEVRNRLHKGCRVATAACTVVTRGVLTQP
jgi:DNA ligase-1